MERLGSSSVTYRIGIFRQGRDQAAAQGRFTHVYVARPDQRPVPIPAPVPIEVEPGLVVCPAWVRRDDAPGEIVLRIEPGATFGMGNHPTTRLCLAALRRLVTPGCSVLDVGCGSGVLAVAACRFGAQFATGIDIAPAAVPVTSANAVANGVEALVTVSTTPLDEVGGTYDVVVANILAPALVALAVDLRRVLAPSGSLVISGVLEHAHRHVIEALAPLRVVSTDVLDGWAAVTLCH